MFFILPQHEEPLGQGGEGLVVGDINLLVAAGLVGAVVVALVAATLLASLLLRLGDELIDVHQLAALLVLLAELLVNGAVEHRVFVFVDDLGRLELGGVGELLVDDSLSSFVLVSDSLGLGFELLLVLGEGFGVVLLLLLLRGSLSGLALGGLTLGGLLLGVLFSVAATTALAALASLLAIAAGA